MWIGIVDFDVRRFPTARVSLDTSYNCTYTRIKLSSVDDVNLALMACRTEDAFSTLTA